MVHSRRLPGPIRTPRATFPTNSYQSSNYWVDPILATTGVTITPANSTLSVANNAAVTVAFSVAMNASSISSSTFELLDPDQNIVPATVSYNATTKLATLTPTSPLLSGETYTVVVHGQSGGVTTSGWYRYWVATW